MSDTPPDWWVALQGEWCRALARPLTFERGTFESPDAQQAASVLELKGEQGEQTSRFVLYHHQVWQRICSTIQASFPCTTLVMGPLLVNRLALLVFADSPPDDRSLDGAADRFGAMLRGILVAPAAEFAGCTLQVRQLLESENIRLPVLQQALQLDLAQRIAFRTTTPRVAKPLRQADTSMNDARVLVNPSLSLLRLTHDVRSAGAPALPFVCHVAVVRSVDGVRTDVLDPIMARLLTFSRSQTVGEVRENIARAVDAVLLAQLETTLDSAIDLAFARNYWLGVT
ncbi:MAG: putative DNA-binding domain-containing protein [Myxococcales bacterium]|nr:putative DNA-binding domain-containing protein [Myxococcales bacterium]